MILVSAVNLVVPVPKARKPCRMLLTTVLLVSTLFSAPCCNTCWPRESDPAQRVRPTKELLRSLAHALLHIAAWLHRAAGAHLGFSVIDFALSNRLGQAISNSLSSIGLIC